MGCREFFKKCIDYHIEGDWQVYRLKHTPFSVRRLMTRRFQRKWGKLPIENRKIVFDNYMGSGFGCNGKYITQELLRSRAEYDIVWTVKDAGAHRAEFPSGIRLVEYLSDEALYEYATAKIWVLNIHLVPYLYKGLRKKEGQFYIQTWHGSLGIKKIERDSAFVRRAENWMVMDELNSAMTDYWISNSRFETDVYTHAFWNARTILEYGHPRNDLFFHDTGEIRARVRRTLGLEKDIRTILYVPTSREIESMAGFEIDYGLLLSSLAKRFGGRWKILMRMHPRMRDEAARWVPRRSGVIDVSRYPDIQELMVCADAMITDYSSAIFDFILTGKPGFLFVLDEELYERRRGLYYSVYETPFPVAASNRELQAKILSFDSSEYERKVRAFLDGKGIREDGCASRRVAQLISSLTQEKRGD